ncbi:MAG: hypothetical protein F6K16_26030 [Symploca sp. SIO2B6]|nr:hypothetical protein [Symploca sp. SIO2B6]
MPAKGFLRQEQLDSLQKTLRESESPQLRERILMLLLMNMARHTERLVNLLVAQNVQLSIGVFTATQTIWHLSLMAGNRATTRKQHQLISNY